MQMVKRRLVAPHTHNGVECNPGEIIELLPAQAEWLDAQQKTEPLPDEAAPKKPKE